MLSSACCWFAGWQALPCATSQSLPLSHVERCACPRRSPGLKRLAVSTYSQRGGRTLVKTMGGVATSGESATADERLYHPTTTAWHVWQ